MKKYISVVLLFVLTIHNSVFAFSSDTNPILNRLRGTDGNSVLILMYHKLSDNPNEISDFCIKPSDFEKDICILKQEGYVFCTAGDLVNLNKENKAKYVLITFDDGYESDYTLALPILEKYNAKATFFVFGGAIGRPDYIDEKQLFNLSQSKNAEIGNHSYNLHNNTYARIKQMYLSSENDSVIVDDFVKNKIILEKITGKSITALSYPNGIHNDRIDTQLRKCGISITFSTNERMERLSAWGSVLGRFNRGMNTDISKIISK